MTNKKIKLSSITFVIPVSPDQEIIRTLESIPKECHILIQREKTRGEARNIGAKLAITDYICFCDSDIKFSEDFLRYVVSLATDKNIIGLQAYYPSPLLISRFLFMKKSIWEDVGEMIHIQHGEETEFLIRCIMKNYVLVSVPRESVYHYPHKKSVHKKEYTNLFRLLWLHPGFFLRILRTVIYKMKVSNYTDETSLPYK